MNVMLCNSAKCTIAQTVEDVRAQFSWPLRAFIVLCAAWQVHHGNAKHISRLPTKGHEVTQQEDVPVHQRLMDRKWHLEIKYIILQFI